MFFQRLNDSPWKGIISEVGIGLEFSSRLLATPGASKTVLAVNCDYAGLDRPANMKAVSLENARRQAVVNLNAAKKDVGGTPFGLAITGAHYEDRDSHAWICFASLQGGAYMHIQIPSITNNRALTAAKLANHIELFLDNVLFKQDWFCPLNMMPLAYGCRIDVLYAPGVSDIERLMLLREDNALLYHGGKFNRVTDYLREYNTIFPGSFNPPTKKHLAGLPKLYELTQTHCYKGSLALEDMLHRIRMLDAAGMPVLITKAPRFIDKHKLISSYVDVSKTPGGTLWFLIGADAWNKTIEEGQYERPEQLGELLPHTGFSILERDGYTINENAVSHFVPHHVNAWVAPGVTHMSSTAVREAEMPSNHGFLTPEVADYVERHRLYLTRHEG